MPGATLSILSMNDWDWLEQSSNRNLIEITTEAELSANIPCDNNQERSSPACDYCHQAAPQHSSHPGVHFTSIRASQLSVGQFVIVPGRPGLTFTEVLVSLFASWPTLDWTGLDWTDSKVINDETPLSSRVVLGSTTSSPLLSWKSVGHLISNILAHFSSDSPALHCTTGCCRYCKLTPAQHYEESKETLEH